MKLPACTIRRMTTQKAMDADALFAFRPKPFQMTISSVEESSMMEISQPPTGVYEAVLPPPENLIGMGLVVILCIGCAWYWTEKVVPVSRANLAISKSRGEVKEYLDGLRATDPKLVEDTNTSLRDRVLDHDVNDASNEDVGDKIELSDASASPRSSERAFERWLFSDWLVESKSE
jgi:hypothetical protein